MTDNIIEELNLSEKDISKINERGISIKELEMQVEQLREGTNFVELESPCTVGDGIIKIDENKRSDLIRLQNKTSREGRFLKFVPASGAASRMFKKLEEFMNSDTDFKESDDFVKSFFNKLDQFAFYDDLKSIVESKDTSIRELISENKYKILLKYLLTDEGLNYSNLPKALIKFHSYNGENRTALEEQVFEAISYLKDKENVVRLHFTIPPELTDEFNKEKEKLVRDYFSKGIELIISYSYQKESTDTVALNKDEKLFRLNGDILFRPGGHGALIQNLNEIDSDYVYIKNIDNVQKEGQLDKTIAYKKIIGGLLVDLQNKVYEYLEELEQNFDSDLINEIEDFITDRLSIRINLEQENKIEQLKKILNKPIRVCGVVVNEGHPGGGPFWVKDKDGNVFKQIIEDAQVDKTEPEQKKIFESSTHFNPVDLVCGIKNYKGEKFDLTNYVDDSSVFVANKSKNGEELKALELPGLWNGAMSDWITIFVEVPKETFTPVKEVNDLLLNYHQ